MRIALLATVLLASGCAVVAQPLADVPLRSARLAPRLRTGKSILVAPFEDCRGAVVARTSADAHIPFVNWFHQGREALYPEHAGLLRHTDARGEAATVGGIDAALPQLLVASMHRSGLTDRAVPGGDPTLVTADFDYVLTGRVLRTTYKEDESGVLQLALGLLGVPYRFARYELVYEIALYDNRDPGRPVFERTYRSVERRASGLYYNQRAAYPMFVRGLERTVGSVVDDLAALISARG